MTNPAELELLDPDGQSVVFFRWLPDGAPRAALHVMHGWGEHALRYDRPARRLADAGFAVYGDDHLGHGRTGQRNGGHGDFGPRGIDGVDDAVHAVTDRIRAEHAGLPVFAFGHSWGSTILTRYLTKWACELAGAMLTGTTYREPGSPPRASRESWTFEGRTSYDWLSRDQAEVDKYVADPLCGFEAVRASGTPAGPSARADERPIPATLPIYVFNGTDDPVGGEPGGRALAEHYRSQGVKDVTFKAYPGARHELLNEMCRDEVIADILDWLDARV